MTTSSKKHSTRSSKASPTQVLFAASERCADLLYLSHFSAPDPFIAIIHKNKSYAFFNALEYTRATKEASIDHILPLETHLDAARKYFAKTKKPLHYATLIIAHFAKHNRISHLEIPQDFPAGIALELQQLGLKLTTGPVPFAQGRLHKSQKEADAIRHANSICSRAFRVAQTILEKSQIRKGKLFYQNKPLTSDTLRTAINITCLEHGAIANHTIVAGGNQACDPHCTGSGPLHANEFIIVDIFPRVTDSGYFGDMTRTFLKGQPSDVQTHLIHTVHDAQKLAFKHLRAGATSKTVHQAVTQHFEESGYKTKKKGHTHVGFFHGTGHGVGLEIHEAPHVSAQSDASLEAGNVVTVEPGLYYPGLGGVRIEDVAYITKNNYSLLSNYPYKWHLK